MSAFPTVFPDSYYLNLITSEYKSISTTAFGTLTYGSNVVTNISIVNIDVGFLVFGTGIPNGTTVTNVGTNTVTLSNNVTDGYFNPVFTFDNSADGFDNGKWNPYSGTSELKFFSAPAPKMSAWLDYNLELGKNIGNCLQSFQTAFNLNTAVGAQLDVLGAILGQSRNVSALNIQIVNGGTGYTQGDILTLTQGTYAKGMTATVGTVSSGVITSVFLNSAGSGYIPANVSVSGGTGSAAIFNLFYISLTDDDYRILLKSKVIQNHWNGQISNIPIVNVASGGTGYSVGDAVTVIQPQAYGMQVKVTAVSSLGTVVSVSLYTPGVNYQTGLCTTTGGNGTGLQIYLPTPQVGENPPKTLAYLWQSIFGPSATLRIIDNGAVASYTSSTVMSADVYYCFPYATSTNLNVLMVNGYLLPRPQGVNYLYHQIAKPYFGFDLNTSNISGFDTGHFV